MKYTDIKTFTKDGDYEVNISLNYLEQTITDYEKEYNLELNPGFQRGHVWTEEQQKAYVEFFLRGGKTGRVIYFNNPMWENYDDIKNYDIPMVCVDGLQRITALRRFLNNEIKVFGHFYKDIEGKPRMINDGLKFNVNNLKTKKEVLQWYLDLNTGGTVHSDEEINRVKNMLKELEG